MPAGNRSVQVKLRPQLVDDAHHLLEVYGLFVAGLGSRRR
jgi:hypothetical protein